MLSIYAILAVEFFFDFDQHQVVVGVDLEGNNITEVSERLSGRVEERAATSCAVLSEFAQLSLRRQSY